MISFTQLFVLIFSLACSTNTAEPPPPAEQPGPNPPTVQTPDPNNDDPKLIWEDDFDGDELNLEDWTYDLGNGCPNCGWGNSELQRYTRDNHRIEDGILIIEAKTIGTNRYSSTRIKTQGKQEFQYGRIEARIKLPDGVGVWPAFWMLGADIVDIGWPACGEIDILEFVGRQPNIVHNAIHSESSHGNTQNHKATRVPDLNDDFHVYAVEWSSQAIEFYFDDRLTYRYSPADKNKDNYPFNKPMFIILNLAIGGTFGGDVPADTEFPQELLVDYVKVYEL